MAYSYVGPLIEAFVAHMAQNTKTKPEQFKQIILYVALMVATFIAITLLKPVYIVFLVFWGMALAFPIQHWVSKTGWRFSRLEWFLMSGFFCMGLFVLFATLYPK